MEFEGSDLLEALERSSDDELDGAGFGIIGMALDGTVTVYNRWESTLSGLSPARVVGNHFFTAVAPCTNNFLVAQRFEAELALDETIDYVFTVRMRPTRVKLRLLKSPTARRQYLVVRRESS